MLSFSLCVCIFWSTKRVSVILTNIPACLQSLEVEGPACFLVRVRTFFEKTESFAKAACYHNGNRFSHETIPHIWRTIIPAGCVAKWPKEWTWRSEATGRPHTSHSCKCVHRVFGLKTQPKLRKTSEKRTKNVRTQDTSSLLHGVCNAFEGLVCVPSCLICGKKRSHIKADWMHSASRQLHSFIPLSKPCHHLSFSVNTTQVFIVD